MHAGAQTACNIEGHVPPADREAVGMDKTPVREYRHRGGASAHVDHGGAEIGFIVCQGRQARRIGTRNHGFNHEMATLYRK